MQEKRIIECTVLIMVIIAALMFFLQLKNPEINLCRQALRGLIKGSYSVQKFIDWGNLKALDVEVGKTYSQLPNEKEKLNYKKAFIKSFSLGFKQVKGSPRAFTHWRLYAKDNEKAVVAVDYSGYNKTLLFTLGKSDRPKLIALEWEVGE